MLETITVDYALENYFTGHSNDTDPAAKCEKRRNVSNQELFFITNSKVDAMHILWKSMFEL